MQILGNVHHGVHLEFTCAASGSASQRWRTGHRKIETPDSATQIASSPYFAQTMPSASAGIEHRLLSDQIIVELKKVSSDLPSDSPSWHSRLHGNSANFRWPGGSGSGPNWHSASRSHAAADLKRRQHPPGAPSPPTQRQPSRGLSRLGSGAFSRKSAEVRLGFFACG